MISDKNYFTVKEVSFLLGVSVKTVYGWTYFGDLRHMKVGGKIRVPQAEVARLLENRTPLYDPQC